MSEPEWTDAEWQALADDLERMEREDPVVFKAARRLDDAIDRIVNREDYAHICPNEAARADCNPTNCPFCAPLVQPEGRIEDE